MQQLERRLPARLVFLWQQIDTDRVMQVVFEWEAPWPEKYVIECFEDKGRLVARSSRLSWETVFEFLLNAYRRAEYDAVKWYETVTDRLLAEGGRID